MSFSVFANGEFYESNFCNVGDAVDCAEEISKDFEFLTVVENETTRIWWVSDFHVQTFLISEKKDSA